MVTASGQLTRSSGAAEVRASRQGAPWPRIGRPLRFRAPRPKAAISARRAPRYSGPLRSVTGATAALPPGGPRPSLRAIFKLRSCRSHWPQRDEPARTAGPEGDVPPDGAAVRRARGGRTVGRGRGASGAVPTPTPEGGGPGAAGRKWGRAARGRPTVRWFVGPCGRGRPGKNCGSTLQAEPGKDCLAAPAPCALRCPPLVFVF